MQVAEDNAFSEVDFYVPRALREAKDFGDDARSQSYLVVNRPAREEDLEQMEVVIGRIRKQLKFIVYSVRCWQGRHEGFDNALRLRYSAYEGTFCYADLRRHWRYYRHAMAEYYAMRK